ncbi:NAD(P)-binding protein [Paramyrothecium foliicola]|nr:NAD(P)-binding protein [Paramyrothecium foliicola]
MTNTIVVVGATGAQGGSVARTFVQLPGWRVRGITRYPSSDAAQALAKDGVDMVQGDLDDKESLIRAFEGASLVFSNTDFFSHFFQAIGSGGVLDGRSAKEYAYDREVAQGLNIAEAAGSPLVQKTLNRFILSSLSHATKWSGGKYKDIYHFDSKAEMIRLTKERYPDVYSKMSTVQVGHYVTNWKGFPKMVPQKQPDGTFLLTRTASPSFKMPHVVTHRDTGPFVKALLGMPAGKNIFAVSEYMTFPKWGELWGRILGVKVVYKQVSNDEFFEGAPQAVKEELGDNFDYIEEFGFTGGDPDVLEPEQLDFKVPVTSMEDYFGSEDWSSVLNE